MGTKNNPGQFDCYAHAEPDEPMFVLLGRDPTASLIVHEWAGLRERLGTTTSEKLAEARQCASAMAEWAAARGKKIVLRLGKVRHEVEWFGLRMEEVLVRNDHKGHWRNCHYLYLLNRLDEEMAELQALFTQNHLSTVSTDVRISAELRERIIREACDVANFAMMIADNASRQPRLESAAAEKG